MKIGIVGATGYGGAELLRILHTHPYAEDCILYSSSEDGLPYWESFPHVNKIIDKTLQPIDVEKMAEEVDFVFLATPPGVSSELTPQFAERQVPVVDLSGDLRMKEPTVYEKWYKRKAAPQQIISEAVYGLSELNAKAIKDASCIANPGCFPTAAILGLAPLVKNRAIKEPSVIIDAKTGVSGAGRKASSATHFSETNENFKIYSVHEHKHTPEIEQMLSSLNPSFERVTFTSHLVPMTRGIMATIYADLAGNYNSSQLHELYKEFYQDSYFVRIRDIGNYPSTKEVYGSNYCDIAVAADERTGRVTIVSVIDNLVKGAAGQAVQNFNLMNGWPEETGLLFSPIYP
ncbi:MULTISPECIES: N-acetyl-gamma-glutamyl-phosphate reductase [Bacillus]|uniref:N-acetyl-gamma-glutamyl-phosphate reductase n=2 Tax=Bacillus TaxID=1386 RepID=A0A0M4FPC3_9BACI|nr:MULTISPECIES: N-acetyl-gamma-glutamyl-phosphate reductase [Bacillus]ALC80709.1 N-acetyl-gamma-glutamyl-phosphate reductase [Bacillus gobiensis]MBP1079604.1 N-acetyl-gamma-glutamyl-phosphate reductase [Bacillus capparidis]MED1095005.1 N-acetyl-gamma-glutamyl-phosphate reductase [Bacillus capparidis]